jgi:predicted nuclease of predicted toxin-antitoxin system
MHEAEDRVIWDFAKENGFTIVTQDSDFHERSILYGFPPKVIWLKVGNTSSHHILQIIQTHYRDLELFESDLDSACLELYES